MGAAVIDADRDFLSENPMPEPIKQQHSSLKNDSTVIDSSDKKSLSASMTAAPMNRSLPVYPEELHRPARDHCLGFNARIMKHLMKQKMQKNQTFLQTKCMDQNGRQRPGA